MDAASVPEDGRVEIEVLANDTDSDRGPIGIGSLTRPSHGSAALAGGGAVAYEPAPNYCGPDFFAYTLNGGSSAIVSVEINCVDDPPIANADSASLTEDDPATAA